MISTETSQERFNQLRFDPAPRSGPESPKITIEQFQNIVGQMANELPPPVANALRATAWLVGVKAFRELEARLIAEGSHETLLSDHRVLLSQIISEGEGILWAVRKTGMPTQSLKFTEEDIAAALESLYLSFRCEHGPHNSQKANELIGQLFDVQKS